MPEGRESGAGCEGKKASGRKEAGEAGWCAGDQELEKWALCGHRDGLYPGVTTLLSLVSAEMPYQN